MKLKDARTIPVEDMVKHVVRVIDRPLGPSYAVKNPNLMTVLVNYMAATQTERPQETSRPLSR
jgi:hypothetical protein